MARILHSMRKNYRKWDWERGVLLLVGLSALSNRRLQVTGLDSIAFILELRKAVPDIVRGVYMGLSTCAEVIAGVILICKMMKYLHVIISELYEFKVIICISLSATSVFFTGIRYGVVDASSCYNLFDYPSALCFLLLLLLVYYWIKRANQIISREQQEELLISSNSENTFKISNLLSLNLELLWDRVSRFELFLASLLLSNVLWIIKVVILHIFVQEYDSKQSCELVYTLVYNRSRPVPDEQSRGWIAMAAVTLLLTNLTIFVMPRVFLLSILETTLIKERYAQAQPRFSNSLDDSRVDDFQPKRPMMG